MFKSKFTHHLFIKVCMLFKVVFVLTVITLKSAILHLMSSKQQTDHIFKQIELFENLLSYSSI